MNPLPTQFLTDFPLFLDENSPKNAGPKPHSCDYWNDLGCADFAIGNYASSLQSFDNAVYLSDKYHHYIHYECAAVYILRARLHLQNENWDAAKSDLNSAIFQDHGAVPAMALSAWIAERIEKDSRSLLRLNQGIRRFEKDYIVPTRWRYVADYRGMLADDSAWINAVKHKDFPLLCLSQTLHDAALSEMGCNPEKAAELLAQVLVTPRAWRHYGEALMKCGKYAEAKIALDEAEVEHKRWHSAYHRVAATHRLNRGLTYEKLDNVLLAWQECAKAADIDKDWSDAKNAGERLAKVACA